MLQDYLKAGYPAIAVLTQEPARAEQILPVEGWDWFVYDCIRGIRPAKQLTPVEEIRDPVMAINWLNNFQNRVLITENLHLFLNIPEVIQSLSNGVLRWKSTGCCLVMVSPILEVSPEVEKLFTVIDLPLPDTQELFNLQSELAQSVNGVETNPKAAIAARGLTEFEAETAFSLSLIKNGRFSTDTVIHAKKQMIKKSGLMEFWPITDINDVGGLENLKDYVRNRAKAFEPGNEHLPRPKGILLVGIPGTGKSLSAKAIANILNWPLIRLDIGALKTSLVGASEQRMREATRVIDAFGNAVIWLDEVEKAFAGVKSSGESDAGTTANIFSHFLIWMQETTTPMIVVATANDVSKLPPEFLRAGRFDAIFFVDLPTMDEKKEIIQIMNRKYSTNIDLSLAEKMSGWSGSEIEQLAKDMLFDGLEKAYTGIVPLSKVMREPIQGLREWARTRARLANTTEKPITQQRKIRSAKAN
jgi:AAA+ superfamily predicted ATPase